MVYLLAEKQRIPCTKIGMAASSWTRQARELFLGVLTSRRKLLMMAITLATGE